MSEGTGPIAVLLVDDHPVVRDGMKAQLASHANIAIIAEAANGQEAVEQTIALVPDIVLLDIEMPVMSGLAAARILNQRTPEAKLVFMSMYDNKEYMVEALHLGARGYLKKDSSREAIIEALEDVHQGELCFPSEIVQAGLESEAVLRDREDKPRLTRREQEVLILIAQEQSSKEIAARLHVSIRTVDAHRQHIMAKLGVRTAVGMTKYAISQGLVSVD